MRVEFYGSISSLFGGGVDLILPTEGETVTRIRQRLADDHDAMEILHVSVRALVNDVIAQEDQLVKPSDSLEFMTPFSGG